MKRNDLLLIIVVAIVAGVFSLIVAKLIFGGEKAYKLKAATVEKISADFQTPDNKHFNSQSLNITQNITIGDSNNSDPFKK